MTDTIKMDRKLAQRLRAFLRVVLDDMPDGERKQLAKDLHALVAALLKPKR